MDQLFGPDFLFQTSCIFAWLIFAFSLVLPFLTLRRNRVLFVAFFGNLAAMTVPMFTYHRRDLHEPGLGSGIFMAVLATLFVEQVLRYRLAKQRRKQQP